MTVEKDGAVLLSGIQVRIGEDGIVTIKSGSLPRITEKESPPDEGGGSPTVSIIVIALVAIILIVIVSLAILFVIRARRKDTPIVGDKCPECMIEMVLKTESGDFYCAQCKDQEKDIPIQPIVEAPVPEEAKTA